jgi:negative regulator of replication initiation
MPMHRIEVDDQVFNYLKTKAEPLVDTSNSVLRRLLLRDTADEVPIPPYEKPPYPRPDIPKALQQILQVIHGIRKGRLSRSEATHQVAAMRNVATQTVIDKYTRQLGLTAYQFDGLLAQSDLLSLKTRLKEKFLKHHAVIDEYLKL